MTLEHPDYLLIAPGITASERGASISVTVDEKEVVRLYTQDGCFLREIARKLGTDHHRIKRVLLRNGVAPSKEGRRKRTLTPEHRAKIGAVHKGQVPWSKGLKMSTKSVRKNMQSRLGESLDISDFKSLEKLKVLIQVTGKHKSQFEGKRRQEFVERFYHDPTFNELFRQWKSSGEDKWLYPSLDHKTPLSRGGDFSLDNLQFLTWFENRAKADMTHEEWETFKRKHKLTCNLLVGPVCQ